ncbi:unnamed protein product [Allacma fusca]|uniref:DNA helicase n=1 Tax=Allacma fusca TaxID=39272 RepID=A0A8J2JVI6_9HEXA|nr:unnamed protein product [Allacma fusca]
MTKDAGNQEADQSLHSLFIEVVALRNHKDSERTMGGNWFSFSNKDYYAVKEIFESEKLFRLLVASVCPGIYGMELVKAGILLSLFGGTWDENETIPRRPDINILVVGDPGLGKSQLLKIVVDVAPRGVYVCGTGSTTAGLTVTLVREGDEFSLEAGALVMADKGICCIDEFDKMQGQHSALLEAMEQQSVSIAKAGVFRTIPARTTVLAAANPVAGHYDNSKTVTENIRINAPLLSRFDLVFILQDRPDKKLDRNIVEHITGFRRASGSSVAQETNRASGITASSEESLFERLKFQRGESVDLIPHQLMRKYIAYAKQYVRPKISTEAATIIKEYYLDLRKHHRHLDSTPVTTRQLESLVRLTEARAKAELREIATVEDARDVLEIFDFSMKGVYDNDNEVTLGFTQDILNQSARSDLTPSASRSLSRNMAKRLAAVLERKAESLQKNIFAVDEIKEFALSVGIESGLERLINVLNNDGFLIKKAPRVYQFVCTN